MRDSRGGVLPSLGTLARTWPWITSVIAAAVVNAIVGTARHFDYRGIEGFSTTNYGWLAFTLVGGLVFAWRLARRPSWLGALVRPVIAAAVSYALCFVAVTTTGLIFLPDQSLAETLTTDAPGRSLPVAVLVLVFGCLAELIRPALARALHR
ncbi:hypothetical protein [Actinopolymorpha pittospori]|uniref:Uncharacterized protein n=1 Tax=Actinopolymorpha pittospori TaxID=648752 RepID=A0A927MSJ6_9ACTN|nr:hypothetical protein [Actinopolymorpha pittospori]MBE1604078.1 hypothetical protein [Actinopolymorpha pittospori]